MMSDSNSASRNILNTTNIEVNERDPVHDSMLQGISAFDFSMSVAFAVMEGLNEYRR